MTLLVVKSCSVRLAGLRSVAERVGITRVREARSRAEAVEAIHSSRPRAALVAAALGSESGIELARALRADGIAVGVILRSPSRLGVALALDAGARGLFSRQSTVEVFGIGVVTLRDGGYYTCSTRAEARASLDARPVKLTAREVDVLRGVAKGCSNAELAVELGIAARTVETHREKLFRKLGGHSATDLTRAAVDAGLVAASDSCLARLD